jgi:hypothetical protein
MLRTLVARNLGSVRPFQTRSAPRAVRADFLREIAVDATLPPGAGVV